MSSSAGNNENENASHSATKRVKKSNLVTSFGPPSTNKTVEEAMKDRSDPELAAVAHAVNFLRQMTLTSGDTRLRDFAFQHMQPSEFGIVLIVKHLSAAQTAYEALEVLAKNGWLTHVEVYRKDVKKPSKVMDWIVPLTTTTGNQVLPLWGCCGAYRLGSENGNLEFSQLSSGRITPLS